MSPFEILLGRTLGIGVTIATALLAVGLVLALAAPGPAANLLLQIGLLVLMGTPMARVLLTCVEYVRERDWFFALNAAGVLVVLGITIWQAWRS
ncbi:DUF1634 domain-containing protein [Luteitalea sp.]|jgi:uncharacterized membrane protein|uniref:DUF1634 domain-containing protein n=1 Tax=Luteitalea sp. TaxID=2004800 RepID=UPI0025B9E384|nr:DUF1634 domain-containing protein [Luteitalea sp.]